MERNDAVRELARTTVGLVHEAQRGLSRAYDAARVGVLRVAAESGPTRPGAIGERLDMAPSSVTRHVQALEDAGHVAVRADPADARTCLIEATAAGRDELDKLEGVGLDAFTEVVADWNVRDLHTLTRLITRLRGDWAERGAAARRTHPPHREPRWRYRPTPGGAA